MGESINLFDFITDYLETERFEAGLYSPLTLAYIGDGIYEIIIRTFIVTKSGNEQVNKLHKKSSSLVKAETQAKLIHAIMEELSPEEERIYKRGRNAKSFTAAKNASIKDYRTATGFEALCGYLYIKGDMERLLFLVKSGLRNLEKI